MKIKNILIKLFVIVGLTLVFLVIGATIYLNLFGKDLLQDKLSEMLGSQVTFASVGLNAGEPGLQFKGLKIASQIDFEKNALNAEKFTVILNEEQLDNKKFVIDEVVIEKGELIIIRDAKGILSVSGQKPSNLQNQPGTAQAAVTNEKNGLYNFAKLLKKLTVKDLSVKVIDYYILTQGLEIEGSLRSHLL